MTKDERARMRAASATWKLSNTYHRRMLALLDALDDKDALIAELIAFAETAIATPDYRYDDILPVLAALKARAGE